MPGAPDLSHCVFASGNRGKLREVRAILADLGIAVTPQTELGITGAAETGSSFVDNALLKASHAARLSGLPAIGDDSGLVVDALDGRPGVQSARYAGDDATDEQNIEKLLDELAGVPDRQRGAAFHCAAVLVVPGSGRDPLVAEAAWAGRILTKPRGDNGFGYDPVFFDPRLGKSAAEMTPEEKNAVSHRARALKKLAATLREALQDPPP